jgi:glycosyltransferase involved in cell wall biosynthesis
MGDAGTSSPPVLIIGRGHRAGRRSLGPEVVVATVTPSVERAAPGLSRHVEPRDVPGVVRGIFHPDTRVVHFLSTGWWSLAAPLLACIPRLTIISTFHGYAPLHTVKGVSARIRQSLSIIQARTGLAGSGVIVAVSARVGEATARRYPLADRFVITNGLSPVFGPGPEPAAASPPSAQPLRLLIVGSGEHKGGRPVLAALAQKGEELRPSITFVGVERSTVFGRALERDAAAYGGQVRIIPPVPHREMPGLYAGHDALLLWSSADAFGLVVLEAMACGIIPVVSDRAGVSALITHGVTGFVVPFGDAAALRTTLRTIREGTHGVTPDALRAAAAAHAGHRTGEAYARLYRRVLETRSAAVVVTNSCPHYRVGVFRSLAARTRSRMLFFADPRAPVPGGTRVHELAGAPVMHVRGVSVPGTRLRITPGLYAHLLGSRYDVVVKCINGKFHVALCFLIARLRRRGFVLWTGLWHDPVTLLHRMIQPVVRLVYRRADAVLVYGPHVRDHLLRSGVSPDRIFLAPQAVDNLRFGREVRPEELEAVRQASGDRPGPMILFAGRLEPEKAPGMLLEACERLRRTGWHLMFAGNGSLRGALEEEAARRLPGRVGFAGSVPVDELPAWYRSAAVLVLPSVTTEKFREPWGLVTNEAFNQGCPVIATTAVGAVAGGLVVDGVTGLVVPEGDPEALTSALERILGDEELRLRLGSEGRRRVEGWTQERMADGFLEAISCARRRG